MKERTSRHDLNGLGRVLPAARARAVLGIPALGVSAECLLGMTARDFTWPMAQQAVPRVAAGLTTCALPLGPCSGSISLDR